MSIAVDICEVSLSGLDFGDDSDEASAPPSADAARSSLAASERFDHARSAHRADIREIRRLERLDRRLGARIAARARAAHHPSRRRKSAVRATEEQEWSRRRALHEAEHAASRTLTLQLFRSLREEAGRQRERLLARAGLHGPGSGGGGVVAAPSPPPQEHATTLAAVQTRIGKTLEMIAVRVERLAESKESDRAAAAAAPKQRRSRSPGGDAAARRRAAAHAAKLLAWRRDEDERRRRKRTQVSSLLVSAVRSVSAGTAASAAVGRGGGGAPRRAKAGGLLASAQRELAALEAEQKKADAAAAAGNGGVRVVATCAVDGVEFELRSDGRLEVRRVGAGAAAQLQQPRRVQRLRYNASSGKLDAGGGFILKLPSRRRSAYEQRIQSLAALAGVPYTLTGQKCTAAAAAAAAATAAAAAPTAEDRAEQLLRYAVEYRTARLPGSADLAADDYPPGGGHRCLTSTKHLSSGLRLGLAIALTFLPESHVQALKVVNRETFSVIESSAYRRRTASLEALARCGISFVKLPKGVYTLGMHHTLCKTKAITDTPRNAGIPEDRLPARYESRHVSKATAEAAAATASRVTYADLDAHADYGRPSCYAVCEEVCLMEEPLRVREWRRVAEAFPEVAGLVTAEDIDLLRYNLCPPPDAGATRGAELVARDDLGGGGGAAAAAAAASVEDCYLELPYRAAAKLAAALAAALPSWQQWEAGVRRFDARPYPWGDSVTDVAVSLEAMPCTYVVPNANKGRGAGNGYIEMGSHMLEVQRFHRAGIMPRVSEAGGTRPRSPPPPPPQSLAHGSQRERPSSAAALRREGSPCGGGRSVAAGGSGRWSAAAQRPSSAGATRRPQQQAAQQAGLTRSTTSVRLQASSWCEPGQQQEQPPRLQRDPTGGAASWRTEASVPSLQASWRDQQPGQVKHECAATSAGADVERALPLPRGTTSFVAFTESGVASSFGMAASMSVAARPSAAEERPEEPMRWLKGVACVGQEWNHSCGDWVSARDGRALRGGVLRSVADLLSAQDARTCATPLPCHFLASNHRAFSGPHAYCVYQPPPLRPLAERVAWLNTPCYSAADADADAVQVRPDAEEDEDSDGGAAAAASTRAAGRGSVGGGGGGGGGVVQRCAKSSQRVPPPIAAVRAKFRLVFMPGPGVTQQNPCS